MKTTRIIGIETSSRTGSIALADGPEVLAQSEFSTQTQHARELLPSLDELSQRVGWPRGEAEVCCVSIGPGSFTGLRVAVTFARHLALARGVKIVAVPTLAVIAENCAGAEEPPSPLAVVLDAKRGQVFAAMFEWKSQGYEAVEPAQLTTVDALLSKFAGKVSVMGEGIDYHADAVATCGAKVVDRSLWTPRAANVCRLGWRLAESEVFTAARDLIPLYIRRPEAEEIWEKREAERNAT